MVPDEGIEPPTFGLQNRCSTAELIRPRRPDLAISRISRAQEALYDPATTVGVQGPLTAKASCMDGQGGIVIARNESGASGSARNWNAVPSGIVTAVPGRERFYPLIAAQRTPERSPAREHVPDLLDRAVCDSVRDRAGRQFEMRHAAAAQTKQQANGGPIRSSRVGCGAKWLQEEGGFGRHEDRRVVSLNGLDRLGEASVGLLKGA